MRGTHFSFQRNLGVFPLLVVVLVLLVNAPNCQASDDWKPGLNMGQSMIRLLAPVSLVVDQSDYGFSDTSYLGVFLRPGGFSYLTMQLSAGETYMFIGAGDDDVRDLDILLEDEEGRVVAQDVNADAVPVVNYAPSRTRRYTLKLKLHDAAVSCFCGVALLKKGGWNVPARNMDVAMENMLNHCRSVASQRAARFLEVPGEWSVIGTIIENGEASSFTDIRLGSGRRVLTSGGDTVTRDIDLEVFEDGSAKVVLDKDVDDDAAPLVQCIANSSKRYGVTIRNAKSQGGTLIFTAILEVD